MNGAPFMMSKTICPILAGVLYYLVTIPERVFLLTLSHVIRQGIKIQSDLLVIDLHGLIAKCFLLISSLYIKQPAMLEFAETNANWFNCIHILVRKISPKTR